MSIRKAAAAVLMAAAFHPPIHAQVPSAPMPSAPMPTAPMTPTGPASMTPPPGSAIPPATGWGADFARRYREAGPQAAVDGAVGRAVTDRASDILGVVLANRAYDPRAVLAALFCSGTDQNAVMEAAKARVSLADIDMALKTCQAQKAALDKKREAELQQQLALESARRTEQARNAQEEKRKGEAVWQRLSGAATDIGMGGGKLWVIGTNRVAGGYDIWRREGNGWTKVDGGAVRIDVDAKGNPWVVNHVGGFTGWNSSYWNPGGRIFRWNAGANKWDLLPGEHAHDIGVGADGTAWFVGGRRVPGGYAIFRWNSGKNGWDAMPGGAVRIDVDPQGNAWVVNDANAIFRWNGGAWVPTPGKARDIGVGADGSVFVVGDNGTVHKWNGTTWIMRDGLLSDITVSETGVPFGVNGSREIWMGYP